jgi:hypothetical protein
VCQRASELAEINPLLLRRTRHPPFDAPLPSPSRLSGVRGSRFDVEQAKLSEEVISNFDAVTSTSYSACVSRSRHASSFPVGVPKSNLRVRMYGAGV